MSDITRSVLNTLSTGRRASLLRQCFAHLKAQSDGAAAVRDLSVEIYKLLKSGDTRFFVYEQTFSNHVGKEVYATIAKKMKAHLAKQQQPATKPKPPALNLLSSATTEPAKPQPERRLRARISRPPSRPSPNI